MKPVTLSIVIILVITNFFSFVIGRQYGEDSLSTIYKEASLMSDAIRLEYDNVEDNLKNCTYTAYSALEEACCEEGLDTDSLLNVYVWCY